MGSGHQARVLCRGHTRATLCRGTPLSSGRFHPIGMRPPCTQDAAVIGGKYITDVLTSLPLFSPSARCQVAVTVHTLRHGTTTECRCSRILILSNANIKFLFILTRPHRLQGSGNSGWRNTTLSARLRDMENSQSGPAWHRAVPTGTISGLPREVTPRVTKALSSPSGGRVELPM